jgi:hypothetical protein
MLSIYVSAHSTFEQFTGFHGTWYERHATRGHAYYFLKSSVTSNNTMAETLQIVR